ncbi:MAG: hypothetical protein Q4A24_01270 [Akkermansia sp.]|nr:hypothetical protein [Akkermansia sp.]
MQEYTYITGFTAGELTPWLSTRFDLQAYRRGAALLNNFEVQPYGGLKRRRGTEYLGTAATQTKGCVRLLPFCFSESDALMLEFFPRGMRVYREGKLLLGADGEPYILSTPWKNEQQLQSLRFTQVNDVIYATCPSLPPHRLSRYGDTDWACEELLLSPAPRETYLPQTAGLHVYPETNGTYARLQTDEGAPAFTTSMLRKEYVLADAPIPSRTYFMNESFSFDAVDTPDLAAEPVVAGTVCKEYDESSKLYYFYTTIRHYTPDYFNGSKSALDYPDFFMPGVLRTDDSGKPYEVCADWEVCTQGEWNAIWELWRSYDSHATDADPHRWQWACIRTFDQTSYAERRNWAVSGSESEPCRMVLVCRAASSASQGAHIYFRAGGGVREYKFRLVFVYSAHEARAELCSQYAQACASFYTRKWSFGAFGERNGYPAFCGLHQGRIWFGGVAGLPTTLFASTVGDFSDFRVTSEDDAALHLTLATDNQSRICWICPSRNLLVGTSEGEWVLDSADGSALSATNAAFRLQSSVGSENMPASGVENTVFYVQRGGKCLREISYKLEADGFTSTDTSLLAEHLFTSGVREWVVQRGAGARVWVLMQDYSIAVLTMNAEQRVTAWQRMSFPGREVLHLAVLPSRHFRTDELWLVARNTSNGTIGIERLSESSVFADAHIVLTPDANGTLSVPHLASAQVVAFPSNAPDSATLLQVDANGLVELGSSAAGVPYTVGIPYRSELHSLPYESERSFNSIRQEGRVRLRLLNSVPSFYYRATAAARWERYSAGQDCLAHPFSGSVRVSQMPIPRIGQGFALYVDGMHDFCLLSLSIEFDFHGK